MADLSDQSRPSDGAPLLRAVVLIVACALAVALFFHVQILNGFTFLFSDRNDGVIQVAVLEHWYDVVRGRAAWNVTGYFYPHADTLGYNDGYLLYGLVYSIFRAFGTDPFLSTELVNVVVKIVGFFAFYGFARRVIRLRFDLCVLGAMLFVMADNSLMEANHAQLLSVAFAPLMASLLWESGVALAQRKRVRGIGFGLAAALFYGAWMLTTFYMAWFFGFFLILVVVVGAILPGFPARRLVWQTLRFEAPAVGVIAVGFVAALVPFLSVYLPMARAGEVHTFAEVMLYSPSVLDIVNVGTGNWLYGGLDRSYNLWLRPALPLFSERTVGFTPLLLVLFAVGIVRTWLRRREPIAALLAAGGGAAVLGLLLVLHFRGFTAWHLVYGFVPGAKAVRAIARYLIFLDFPLILIAVWALESIWPRLPAAARVVSAALLLAEQIVLTPPIALDRAQQMRFLASLPPPPADCRAFYAATEQPPPYMSPAIDGIYSGNVAAMLIATYVNLPTISGHSSIDPPDWNFAYPGREDYLARVRHYAALHHLSGLCGFDFRTNRWLEPLAP